MPYCLVSERREQAADFVTRFDPRFWTVNFPRPAMASVVSTAADALRVDAAFYREGDLVGLIWEAEDRHDHPLLRYETARDFRGCRLSFRWRSSGVVALDAVNGPTLTIEARDAAGAPFTAYIRLWNYAVGTPEDALVTLDFAALAGGFAPGGAAVCVGGHGSGKAGRWDWVGFGGMFWDWKWRKSGVAGALHRRFGVFDAVGV